MHAFTFSGVWFLVLFFLQISFILVNIVCKASDRLQEEFGCQNKYIYLVGKRGGGGKNYEVLLRNIVSFILAINFQDNFKLYRVQV